MFEEEKTTRDNIIIENKTIENETMESRENVLTLTVGELTQAPALSKKIATPGVMNLGSLSLQQLRKGISRCMFMKKSGYLDELPVLPIEWFETELSCCIMTNGEVEGFLLIHKTTSGELDVKLMSGFGESTSADLFKMIQYAAYKAVEIYSPQTQVVIQICNKETELFVEKLFGKKAEA